ncbi:unnamed protein product [Polarella glacialis]|uniref:Uncharacterized protein n=1 Tax=Polarella glacialis TaxID=89957 RepID=A0A813I2H1_POLGL|nr:unnamed protein product [Polarella glacialis]
MGSLFAVLFKQQDWAAEDWGVDQELKHVIKTIMSLGLCNSAEIAAAKKALYKLGLGFQEDYQDENAKDGKTDAGESSGEEEADEAANKGLGQRKILGMHRGFQGLDDDLYGPAFQQLKPMEDFGGRLPETRRTPANAKELKQNEGLQDFLYELVEMPDSDWLLCCSCCCCRYCYNNNDNSNNQTNKPSKQTNK